MEEESKLLPDNTIYISKLNFAWRMRGCSVDLNYTAHGSAKAMLV